MSARGGDDNVRKWRRADISRLIGQVAPKRTRRKAVRGGKRTQDDATIMLPLPPS